MLTKTQQVIMDLWVRDDAKLVHVKHELSWASRIRANWKRVYASFESGEGEVRNGIRARGDMWPLRSASVSMCFLAPLARAFGTYWLAPAACDPPVSMRSISTKVQGETRREP